MGLMVMQKFSPYNNNDKSISCSLCKTDCLKDIFENLNLKENFNFKTLPFHIQNKIELFRNKIIDIDNITKKPNFDFSLNLKKQAQKQKEEALEFYVEILDMLKKSFGLNHPISQNFFSFVELVISRHASPKTQQFLGEE